jgi:hypothetical protein
MFTRDKDGYVRLRREGETVELDLDITKTATCYAANGGGWIWRLEVDAQLQRGSGRALPNAFAQYIGCGLGEKIDVESNFGPVVFSWPMSSSAGASVGSLRPVIEHFDAVAGDCLFLTCSDGALDFGHLPRAELDSIEEKLARAVALVGRDWSDNREGLINSLCQALLIEPSDDPDQDIAACRSRLISRGDSDIANLLGKPKLSVDDYLSNMERMLKP